MFVRQGRLYDKLNHTDKFDPLKAIYFNIVWKWDYEDLPSVFKRYITLRASGRAATQLVTNPQLVQLLATQEAQARAACMEYECNQGDHTFFGTLMVLATVLTNRIGPLHDERCITKIPQLSGWFE